VEGGFEPPLGTPLAGTVEYNMQAREYTHVQLLKSVSSLMVMDIGHVSVQLYTDRPKIMN